MSQIEYQTHWNHALKIIKKTSERTKNKRAAIAEKYLFPLLSMKIGKRLANTNKKKKTLRNLIYILFLPCYLLQYFFNTPNVIDKTVIDNLTHETLTHTYIFPAKW